MEKSARQMLTAEGDPAARARGPRRLTRTAAVAAAIDVTMALPA